MLNDRLHDRIFDTLEEGDEFVMQLRYRPNTERFMFLEYSCETKLFMGRPKRVWRITVRQTDGAIVSPKTSDIVPGSMRRIGLVIRPNAAGEDVLRSLLEGGGEVVRTKANS